ncbi:beta-1,4 N-acetylgalactosaminyltransferase 2-like [Engraulis encrasicolus]|uniref:beta-1,4 N-acetylgalactosaminyltransferase 2-like n=1 Tax=Engraulis encrasicolus TaxID=184585 RepID=UPI002FD381FD
MAGGDLLPRMKRSWLWLLFISVFLLAFCFLMYNPTLNSDYDLQALCPALSPTHSSATIISRRVPKPCSCNVSLLKDFFKNDDAISRRRQEEYRKHKTRVSSPLDLILVAPANSPLQYPIQGFNVVPLKDTPIPGLGVFTTERDIYKVSLEVSRGVLSVRPLEGGLIEGDGSGRINITALAADKLNDILSRVYYASTVYRIRTGDLVHFTFENHKVTFPVVIEQPSTPIIFDPGEEFFVDALGRLLIASCNHVIVDHQTKRPGNEQYHFFRKQTENDINRELYYFKNHFNCINLRAD